MFNAKKFAQSVDTQTTRLEEQRSKYDASLPSVTGNMNDLLSDSRKETTGDETHEGQLAKSRKAAETRTTDGQLGQQKNEFGRKDNENDVLQGLPINNLALAREQEQIKAFNKSRTTSGTDLWDALIGSQLDGKKTTQIGQGAKSQLQNHIDRVKPLTTENVKDNKKLKEMVMASLKDADAMLFHIYHTAAGRDLSKEEQLLVDGINSDKAKIIATLA